MRALTIVVLAACGSSPHVVAPPAPPAADNDPDGPHRAAVAAQIQPYIDGEIASGIVVGIYDAGKLEIYGFGKGPDGKPPNGKTLFELGSITKVYTSLLLADAIQRREVTFETPVADLLPPGVTVPTRDKAVITLKHLALHSSGLPRLPPSIAARGDAIDPYAKFNEDALYSDLQRTALESAPGAQIVYSNYGAGLLGFALGRKIGGGYANALELRILKPLGLADTYFTVPAAATSRRAAGTNDDLASVPPWTFDALAGAGALISTARDQLALIDAELDAAAGGKQRMGPAMRLTQEAELEHAGDNEGLGWQIDSKGRFWHNGGTGGFRSFIGFDPKTKRGVVVLASTSVSLIDHLVDVMYKVLDSGDGGKPPSFPTADQLAKLPGKYQLDRAPLVVSAAGKRLYLQGPGEPKFRLVPISDHEFWIEELQSVAAFESTGGKVTRAVFVVGENQMSAPRIDDATGTAPPPAP